MIIAWRKKFFIKVINTRNLNCWMVLHVFLLKIPCISSHQVFCFSEATTLSSSLVLFDVPQSRLTPSLKKVILYFYLCVYLCIKYISILREDTIIPSLKNQPLIFFFFFYFTVLYWFCHTSTWIRHGCTRVPNPEPHPPPPSLYHPSGSSQCTSPKHPVSCIKPGLAIHFLYDIIHVSMPFSQIIPRSLSHRVQKTVLYICVSFAVSHTGLLLPSF